MNRNIDILSQSAQYVKGVGPQKIKLLNRLNIRTVHELLYHFPRRYEDRGNFQPINKAKIGNMETIKGKVLTLGVRRTKSRLKIFHLAVADKTGVIYGTWFNQPYLKDVFKIGDEVILYGKIERYRDLQINSPEYEILRNEDDDNTIHTGRIVPIYPSTQNISQRYLRKLIKNCLDSYLGLVEECFPMPLLDKNKLLDLKQALASIHFPESFALAESARKRLIFDEFFFLELALASKRKGIKERCSGIKHNIEGILMEKFRKSLPFELTKSQKKVIAEIEADMASGKPMNRLLQGDVGSGKTIVSIWAQVICVQNGYQAALMAPTEILAEQHYHTISKFLKPLGVKVAGLAGGIKKAAKAKIISRIKDHKVDIVIGTHALIQQEVVFKKLGLVIVDEQHKFGVLQRMELQKKAVMPDVLVMSATPIPRTLAITLFGDLDISTINELPPGRNPVQTYWISEKKRKDLYEFLAKKIKEKNQVYVVYPVIEQSKLKDLKAATRMYEQFKNEVFSDFKVGLLHGRMKDAEKNKQMLLFKQGKIDILVATTVIEVGIDIANASVMLIEHADRFGLSQLHQLRGRVGRGQRQAYCILVSCAKTEDATKRLNAMTNTNDGFKIAEYDLLIRGPGEFFGSRQHGLPELRIGNILTDRDLLETARKEAFAYLKQKVKVADRYDRLINSRLKEKFPKSQDLVYSR